MTAPCAGAQLAPDDFATSAAVLAEGKRWDGGVMIYLATIETEQDRQQFTALYERYRYVMLHTAMRVLKNQSLAEDAVHNAFLKIIDCMDRFNDLSDGQSRALAIVIVRNKALDIWRQEKRREALPLEEELVCHEVDEQFSPAAYVIGNEAYDVLTGCIAKLGLRYQSALELKYICGYTDDEIASICDTTRRNVQARLLRAKKALAAMLEEEAKKHAEP